MRGRRTFLGVVLVASALGTPAYAKPHYTSCERVVTDPAGDGHSAAAPVVSSPALDIVSAGFVPGRTTFAVNVRVTTTSVDGDPWAYLGYGWSFSFQATGLHYTVARRRSVNSDGSVSYKDSFSAGNTTSALPPGSSVRMDGTSYTWVLPRSAFVALKKPKTVLSHFEAGSTVFGGNADQASTTRTYRVGDPGCIEAA
jgi:hypothetical protein